MSLKNNSTRLLLLVGLLSAAFITQARTRITQAAAHIMEADASAHALQQNARMQGDSFSGRWEMEATSEGDTLSVMMGRMSEGGGKDNRYFKLALAELAGLTRGQIFSKGERVSFELRRPAGTFILDGQFREGKGEGVFHFTADSDYIEKMKREGYGEAVEENLFGFAIGNFGGKHGDELAALGVERPTPEQLKSMSLFGVSVEFIKELKALGYEPRSIDKLIAMRIHGASIDFIKGLQARGYERPTLDQLIGMRIHGATLAFIDELKALGYERVPVDELTAMRIHGVTTDFIRQLKARGYADVPVDSLIDVKIFQMPVEFLAHIPARDEREKSSGEWRVKFYRRGTSVVWTYLRDRTGRIENRSFEISPDELKGLTEAQAFSAKGANVSFTFTRGGSKLVCTGWFKDGFGAGVFTHAVDADKAANR